MKTLQQLHDRTVLAISPVALMVAQVNIKPDKSKAPGAKGLEEVVNVDGDALDLGRFIAGEANAVLKVFAERPVLGDHRVVSVLIRVGSDGQVIRRPPPADASPAINFTRCATTRTNIVPPRSIS